ncbi:hypothetical protein ABKX71_002407 [Aeromonas veronii]|uniref:hypothetical protein n=1 Tax=Aeromonas veronii TaxID=654 RepID=UPI001F1E343B|nr:hypothetical protein [Aeromonas veronii]MCF5897170.1 hypothetical protein [Aeromonas veronii]
MPRWHPLSPLVAANSAKVVDINRIYGFSDHDPIFTYACLLCSLMPQFGPSTARKGQWLILINRHRAPANALWVRLAQRNRKNEWPWLRLLSWNRSGQPEERIRLAVMAGVSIYANVRLRLTANRTKKMKRVSDGYYCLLGKDFPRKKQDMPY